MNDVVTQFFPQFLTQPRSQGLSYEVDLSKWRLFEYVGVASQMHWGLTGIDRRTLPVATGDYVAEPGL